MQTHIFPKYPIFSISNPNPQTHIVTASITLHHGRHHQSPHQRNHCHSIPSLQQLLRHLLTLPRKPQMTPSVPSSSSTTSPFPFLQNPTVAPNQNISDKQPEFIQISIIESMCNVQTKATERMVAVQISSIKLKHHIIIWSRVQLPFGEGEGKIREK